MSKDIFNCEVSAIFRKKQTTVLNCW